MNLDEFAWTNTAKRYYIYDPIDNSKVLRTKTREQIWAWCTKNCKGKHWVGMGFAQFELESDALLFLLRWGK